MARILAIVSPTRNREREPECGTNAQRNVAGGGPVAARTDPFCIPIPVPRSVFVFSPCDDPGSMRPCLKGPPEARVDPWSQAFYGGEEADAGAERPCIGCSPAQAHRCADPPRPFVT